MPRPDSACPFPSDGPNAVLKEDGIEVGFGPEHAYMAGFVLANGSMSSNQSGKGDIRLALIEADLVDTALRDSAFPQSEATPQVLSKAKNNMVALPGQLFYSTQIPVCLWFTGKMEPSGKCRAVSKLELALAA